MAEQLLTGSQILCRALLEQGVDLLFGYPGGAIMPFYHALPEYPGAAPRAGAPRAGRGARGRRLRPRERAAGRVRGDVGARRHQPGDRPRHGAHGQHAGGRHHRPGAARDDRPGRLPGDRHHRHHPADHQAQPPGRGRRASWPTRCARRSRWRTEGRPGPVLVDVPKDVQNQKAEWRGRADARAAGPQRRAGPLRRARRRTALVEAAPAHRRGRAAADHGRARRHPGRRLRRAARSSPSGPASR